MGLKDSSSIKRNYAPNRVNGVVGTSEPSLSKIISVAAGSVHSVALSRTGTIYSWGSNSNGQLGNGTSGVDVNSRPVQALGLTGMTAITAKGNHTMARKLADDTGVQAYHIYSWGNNAYGELMNGAVGSDQSTPTITIFSDTGSTLYPTFENYTQSAFTMEIGRAHV